MILFKQIKSLSFFGARKINFSRIFWVHGDWIFYNSSVFRSGIMEARSQILVPSPSSPDNALVSPETLSHHSSPAKGSRVLHYAHHVTIDERVPHSLRSSAQLLQQHMSQRSTPSSPPPPFHSGPMTPAGSTQAIVPFKSEDSQMERTSTTTNNNTTQHLSVLYQTHHHLHPILTSPMRRPSRLPDSSRFLTLQQQTLGSSQKEIKA